MKPRSLPILAACLLPCACASSYELYLYGSFSAAAGGGYGDGRKAQVITDINVIQDPGLRATSTRASATRDSDPREFLYAGDRLFFVADAPDDTMQEQTCLFDYPAVGDVGVIWATRAPLGTKLQPLVAQGPICYYRDPTVATAPKLWRVHASTGARVEVPLGAEKIHGAAWVGTDVYVLYHETASGPLKLASVADGNPSVLKPVWEVPGRIEEKSLAILPVAGETVLCFCEDGGDHRLVLLDGDTELLPGKVHLAADTPNGLYLVTGSKRELYLRLGQGAYAPVQGEFGPVSWVTLMAAAEHLVFADQVTGLQCASGDAASPVELPWPYDPLQVAGIAVLDGLARVLMLQVDPGGDVLYGVHTVKDCEISSTATLAGLDAVAGPLMVGDSYLAFLGTAEDGLWHVITLDLGAEETLTPHEIVDLDQGDVDFGAGSATGSRSVFAGRHQTMGLEPYVFPVWDGEKQPDDR